MTDKIIADGWDEFWQSAQQDYDEDEGEHYRLMFYCGAFFMMKKMGALTTLVVGDHDKIEAMKKELTEFYEQEIKP